MRPIVLLIVVGLLGFQPAWAQQGASTSCLSRCGDPDGTPDGCKCGADCSRNGNCCSDYENVCLTCANRCPDPVLPGAPCQCNAECDMHGTCCQDFEEVCQGSTKAGNVTDEEILAVSEELYALDSNSLASLVEVNVQGLTSSSATDDRAPYPLITSVDPDAFTRETVMLFEALRDNYIVNVTEAEDNTAAEQAEVAAFLDAVMATPLMVRLDEFMTEKQLLPGPLKDTVDTMWFTLYSRRGTVEDSSGFEHVFMGELDSESVLGFHNWISFHREEEAGSVNYMGFLEYADLGEAGYVITDRFTWFGASKPIGGGYVGTSPEFELAMYTLCFFTRPNSLCHVQTNGHQYSIQTYDHNGELLVGTAYTVV